jgi:hypothetical protein
VGRTEGRREQLDHLGAVFQGRDHLGGGEGSGHHRDTAVGRRRQGARTRARRDQELGSGRGGLGDIGGSDHRSGAGEQFRPAVAELAEGTEGTRRGEGEFHRPDAGLCEHLGGGDQMAGVAGPEDGNHRRLSEGVDQPAGAVGARRAHEAASRSR